MRSSYSVTFLKLTLSIYALPLKPLSLTGLSQLFSATRRMDVTVLLPLDQIPETVCHSPEIVPRICSSPSASFISA